MEETEENISDVYQLTNTFIDYRVCNQIAESWLENHGKLNINERFNRFFVEKNNVKKNSKSIQAKTARRYNSGFRTEAPTGYTKISRSGSRAERPGDIASDNRGSESGADDIRWNRNAKRGSYIFRTYTEAKEGTLTKNPEPKESNFTKDKEKSKIKRGFKDSATVNHFPATGGIQTLQRQFQQSWKCRLSRKRMPLNC